MFSWFKKKNTAPANDTVLRQVLQSKHCGQCPRNCNLSAPKCGRGKRLAQAVKENYKTK